jgi:FemAB-related protein (PEP-CTERM system-associated)
MKIVRCGPVDGARWDAFVARTPGASFYHRFGWKVVNEEMLHHETAYLAAQDDDGTIRGIFPLVQVKSWLFGNLACSMPFVNYGGPVAETPAVEQQLIDAAAGVCDAWKVEYLEIRSMRHLGDALPASAHKVSMTVDLDRDPDVLWNRFTTSHRQQIRRGYKNGLTATFGGAELLGPFFEVMSESWHQLGTPFYRRTYFDRILRAFGDDVRIAVVYADGRPAAVAFDGLQQSTVEGMWLGIRAEYRQKLVGYVLYWELIKHACEGGHARFHLGRSSVDSAGETFKKKWNATATPLYWHYLLRTRQDVPQLNVTNPKYQRAIEAWRRLPIALTRVIGPPIARSIP